MYISAKYRVETNKGTMLFLETKHIPADINKIIEGEPFAFSATNECKEGKNKLLGRNRVLCTGSKTVSDGLLLYVSLYIEDLGKGK